MNDIYSLASSLNEWLWESTPFLGVEINHLFIASFVLATIAVNLILRRIRHNLAMLSMLLLPGVMLHELMHFLVAFITNAKPCGFSIIPRRVGDQFVLGSVQISNLTFYNAIPVAMAPALLVPIAIVVPSLLSEGTVWWQTAGAIFLQGVLAHSALPSSQDWKVALSKPMGWVFYGGAAYAAIAGPQQAVEQVAQWIQ